MSGIVAVMVFLAGFVNVMSAFNGSLPERLRLLRQVLPMGVSDWSRTLVLVSGFLLITLAYGLWRRHRRAWRLAVGFLIISFITHLTKGLDYEEALLVGGAILILWYYRSDFTVVTGRTTWRGALTRALVVLVCLFIYAIFGFYLFAGQFNRPITLTNIELDYEYSVLGVGRDVLVPRTRQARWFSGSISVVGVAALVLTTWSLFLPAWESGQADEEDRKKAEELAIEFGDNPLSVYSLRQNLKRFFSQSGQAYLAFKEASGMIVVLGSPVGQTVAAREEVLKEFKDKTTESGKDVVFYGLTSIDRDEVGKIFEGLQFKVGDDAVIDLNSFDIELASLAEVRHGLSRVEREKIKIEVFPCSGVPWKVLSEVTKLRQEWLDKKNMAPIGFSNDYFPLPTVVGARLMVAYDLRGELVAALSFLPYKEGRAMVLDLMLRSSKAFNGLMEGLIAYSASYFKNLDVEELNLGMAPLTNASQSEVGLVEKGMELVSRRFKKLYSYQPLYAFKKKFNPNWEPIFVAYPSRLKLPGVLLAMIRAHLS